MHKRKICSLMAVLVLAYGCSSMKGHGAGTDAALAIASLPFKIVGALVGAAIGAASGMGYAEGELGK